MSRGRRRAGRVGFVVLLLAGALAASTLFLPRAGPPQPLRDVSGKSVETALGSRYQAGTVRRFLLGSGYREAWAAPVRLPVLELAALGGGALPDRRGGGGQTLTLHMRGRDGSRYVFRSVDKNQGGTLHAIPRAILGPVRQDQVSALHPGAAVVAASLHRSADLPQMAPRLVVMADDPALGRFRAEFAGLPGIVERYPGDGFGGAPEVVSTDDLWGELRSGGEVDARGFLVTRLMDVYLGDWDRHDRQWRWAGMPRAGGTLWVPIARDRDYALVDYRGALPALARWIDPKVVRFDREYRDLGGLLVKSRPLDLRLLCGLRRPTWDSAATALARSLTDAEIARAVQQLPPEHARAHLRDILQARRDGLPAAAARFHQSLRRSCG
jgi:hypothetical protein